MTEGRESARQTHPVPVQMSATLERVDSGIEGCTRCPLLILRVKTCWSFSLRVIWFISSGQVRSGDAQTEYGRDMIV